MVRSKSEISNDHTVPQLKELLDNLGIEHPKRARKAALVDLVYNHEKEQEEQEEQEETKEQEDSEPVVADPEPAPQSVAVAAPTSPAVETPSSTPAPAPAPAPVTVPTPAPESPVRGSAAEPARVPVASVSPVAKAIDATNKSPARSVEAPTRKPRVEVPEHDNDERKTLSEKQRKIVVESPVEEVAPSTPSEKTTPIVSEPISPSMSDSTDSPTKANQVAALAEKSEPGKRVREGAHATSSPSSTAKAAFVESAKRVRRDESESTTVGSQDESKGHLVQIDGFTRPVRDESLRDFLVKHGAGEVFGYKLENFKRRCLARVSDAVQLIESIQGKGVRWTPQSPDVMTAIDLTAAADEAKRVTEAKPKPADPFEHFRKTDTKPSLFWLPRDGTTV